MIEDDRQPVRLVAIDECHAAGEHRAHGRSGACLQLEGGTDIVIQGNTIVNSGTSNSFWYPSDEDGTARFRWQRWISSLNDFKQTPTGSSARYLSAQERDQVLSTWGIPRAGGG